MSETKQEVFDALLKEYAEDEEALDLEFGHGISGKESREREIELWRKRYTEAQ